MSKLSPSSSSRVMSSGLFAALVVGTAAVSTVACSNATPDKKTAWSCNQDAVPQGEVVRCTSSALTSDGPVNNDPTISEPTYGGTPDSTITYYECAAGVLSDECPPVDGAGSVGSTGGDTTGGATIGDPSDGSNAGSTGATSSSSGDVPSEGSTGGDTTTGPGKSSNGSSKGSTGPGQSKKTHECGYCSDLPYCEGDGTSGSSSSSSGSPSDGSQGGVQGNGSSSGGSSSGTPNEGASSSSSSGSNGSSKGGKHWKCKKTESGARSCVSVPDCAPGSHPAECGACVSDSDGSGDCVPPTEGGCWVTGGGFIEAASLVPAAAADGNDNFGGNAKPMKDGTIKGHWNHVDHGTGNHAKGRPEYILCRHVDEPGPGQPGGKKGLTANQVYFGGHAEWRTGDTWASGYWFDVVAKDHGEPGSKAAIKKGGMPDSYHITVRRIDDPTGNASGTVVYETKGELVGGNIQMHPSNGGHPAVSSPLPAWVSLEP